MVSSENFLNGVVLALFARSRQLPCDRPDRIGALTVAETPEEAAQILNSPDLFAKNFALVAAFGPSRFNQNGAEWAALRPRTQRAYARAGRPVMETEIAHLYDAELARAAPDAAGIEAALARAALRVFFLAFGLAPDVDPFLSHFAHLRRVVAELQHISWQGGAAEDISAVQARATEATRHFAAVCAAQPPVLAAVTRLAGLSPTVPLEVMLADFMTNMFAGIETTTASLAWMIDAVGRNDALQDALRHQAGVTGGPTPLLASFRNECLRVFTPIPFVVRQATAATRLGRHQLQPGTLVMLSLIGLHRDPGSWSSPQEFHAARAEFAPGAPPNPAFRPFLSGPRACGGRRIAEMEISAALRLLVTRFRFRSPTNDPAFTYALAFRPALTQQHLIDPL